MKNILLVQKKILPLQTFCIVRAIRVRKRASFLGKYGRNGKFDFLKGVKIKRTMKINVNVFIGSAMCILIIAVIGGLYRMNKDQDTWRPGDIYSHLGNGASYSSVTSTSSDNADKVLVSMRGGRVLGSARPVASAPVLYAHASSASIANSQSPISSSSTGALYTTSSAAMKSFGGGNMQNGGVSGASTSRASMSGGSQSPIAYSQLPITNSQSPISNSSSSIAPDNEALMAAAAYAPMGSSMYGIGSMPALGGVYSGTVRGIGGRKNAAPGGLGLGHWLDGMTAGEGNPFLYEDGGIRYYDEAALRAWFEANKDDNFPGLTWDEFLEYFNGEFNGAKKYAFPVGEPWALLVLALGYVGYMLVRRVRTRARGI